jgi:hypothetical protein
VVPTSASSPLYNVEAPIGMEKKSQAVLDRPTRQNQFYLRVIHFLSQQFSLSESNWNPYQGYKAKSVMKQWRKLSEVLLGHRRGIVILDQLQSFGGKADEMRDSDPSQSS